MLHCRSCTSGGYVVGGEVEVFPVENFEVCPVGSRGLNNYKYYIGGRGFLLCL